MQKTSSPYVARRRIKRAIFTDRKQAKVCGMSRLWRGGGGTELHVGLVVGGRRVRRSDFTGVCAVAAAAETQRPPAPAAAASPASALRRAPGRAPAGHRMTTSRRVRERRPIHDLTQIHHFNVLLFFIYAPIQIVMHISFCCTAGGNFYRQTVYNYSLGGTS